MMGVMGDLVTIPDKGKSAFTGVTWNKRSKKWQAQIKKDGKPTNLGYFDDEEEAARKFDEVAATLGRPLNFPKAEGEARAVKNSRARDLSKIPDKGKSAFTGVYWNKSKKRWQAQIQIDGKQTNLGCFDDEDEAVRKYDEAAATLGRPLNFPKAEGEARAVKNSRARDRSKIPDKWMSAFRGVYWNNVNKKWVARISKDGKQAHLGNFDDEDEAARKYDEAAATLGRPLNFPKAEGEARAVKNSRWRDLSKIPDKGKSAFRGVCWDKGGKKWVARIWKDGKQAHLGNFDDEEEAARKFDEAAATLGRPLNFPRPGVTNAVKYKANGGGELSSVRAAAALVAPGRSQDIPKVVDGDIMKTKALRIRAASMEIHDETARSKKPCLGSKEEEDEGEDSD
jgi:hypothetical protein